MTQMQEQARVFLFFSVRDEAAAQAAARTLSAAGCAVFAAPAGLNRGEAALEGVPQLMIDMDAMVVLASADAINSQWMAFELGAAMASAIPVYVVSSAGVPLPIYLQQTRVLNAADLDELGRSLQLAVRPFTAVEQKVLIELYAKSGVPTDQLLMSPDAGAKLVREFNRRTRGNASLRGVSRELLRLRKAGKLPKLRPGTREAKSRKARRTKTGQPARMAAG